MSGVAGAARRRSDRLAGAGDGPGDAIDEAYRSASNQNRTRHAGEARAGAPNEEGCAYLVAGALLSAGRRSAGGGGSALTAARGKMGEWIELGRRDFVQSLPFRQKKRLILPP